MKPILLPAYHRLRAGLRRGEGRHKSIEETHAYWREPTDAQNAPDRYLEPEARSRFLLQLLGKYLTPDSRILEMGCNVGRNLHHLYSAGYKNLAGVEISEPALRRLRETFPAMAQDIRLINAPLEEAMPGFEAGEFDLAFSMAVLEHIHGASEWVFADIVRATRTYLVTVEDEHARSWRHFPRNYKKIFESLGMRQVEVVKCLEEKQTGLPWGFRARVFRHT